MSELQIFLVAPEHIYDSPDPDEMRNLKEMYYASDVREHIANLEDINSKLTWKLERIEDLLKSI